MSPPAIEIDLDGDRAKARAMFYNPMQSGQGRYELWTGART